MCTSPNIMLWTGRYTYNDRPEFSFLSGKAKNFNYDDLIKRKLPFVQVPCQQCLECRIQQKRVWADRCVIEAKNSPFNYFITLTYDDAHLKSKSLEPRDLQLFIKRLRKKLEPHRIRFFGCGEYGDKSLRPHFHLILFDCPLPDLSYMFYQEVDGDLKQHFRPENSGDLKFSKIIFDAWHHQGQISVAPFSWECASYVAGYCMKKLQPKVKEWYKETGRTPEFIRCSQGIGRDGYSDEVYEHDNIVVGGHVSSVPRYFDKLFIKKYGDDVFDHLIRPRRLYNRFERQKTYLHSFRKQKEDNDAREYRNKKSQRLRSAI